MKVAKPKKDDRVKLSVPERVDEYMKTVKHPLRDVMVELRKIILSADKEIGEEIKWNAPAFFYAGDMSLSNPKEYRRYLVVFNLFRKDYIRLVYWKGASANDQSGLLEGDYADGRRLALFYSLEDVKAKKKALQTVLKAMLKALDRS